MRYEREDLQQALKVLQEGGIILYPTDTVWGIGCDATNAEAVAKIYALKRREDAKSMLCLVDAPGRLQAYVQDIPETAWAILEANAPEADERPENGGEVQPITIIYPRARNVAQNLIAEDGSLGIRITSEIFSKTLCQMLKRPIVSTSANISGEATAKFYGEISREIREGVDYVVKFRRGDTTPHKPSSIIKVGDGGLIEVIRK